MRKTHQVPDPAAVAWWLHTLKIHAQGCIKPVPDPADPLAVAVYNEVRASSRPKPRTKPALSPNRLADERDRRDEYSHDHH